MWPFENRLKDQDALERYRRWLRRWLLNGQNERNRPPTNFRVWGIGSFSHSNRTVVFKRDYA